MESHEIISQALDKSGAKAVAAHMGVSLSLVYKWGQGQDATGEHSSNPLDRVQQLYEVTGDDQLIQWLSQKCGGVFVRNPPSKCVKGFEVVPATQEIVKRFADMLSAISKAASDSHISDDEAASIRHEWDDLKRYAEGFVRCCEEGDFVNLAKVMHMEPGKPARK